LISITLDDQPLDVVVSMFNRMPGVNLIANPTNLQGKVTVNLTDVQWKPALVSMLEMHNLHLVERTPGSQVYSIVPRAPDAPDPMEVTTVFLQYAKVGDVVPLIKPMLVPNGTIAPFSSRNAVVIRSTAPNLREIEQIVERIDTMRDQVFIEAKFMELNDGAIRDLGINWQILEGYGVGARNLNWSVEETQRWNYQDRSTTSDTDTDTSSREERRGYNMTGTEMAPPIITHYTEIPGTADGNGNSSYDSWSEQDPTVESVSQQNRASSRADTTDDSYTETREIVQTAVLGADDFRIVLSALQQQAGVKIVSNPKIVVANEEPAVIHIGQTERPFVASITAGQNGIAPVVTYNPGDQVDFGVKLMVTPTVNTASNITVHIEPELTRFVRNAVAPNGQTYPIIASKKIRTVFCVESGRTVAIGGLTETEDRENVNRIPLLGDIPFLGRYLFTHTHTEKAQKETIIFVTVGLAVPATMQQDAGLPEDTELARRQLLHSRVGRARRDAELLKTKRQLEAELERELRAAQGTPEADAAKAEPEIEEEAKEPASPPAEPAD
jgi:type II secretory pathway component GspD/PulD (secretin)